MKPLFPEFPPDADDDELLAALTAAAAAPSLADWEQEAYVAYLTEALDRGLISPDDFR